MSKEVKDTREAYIARKLEADGMKPPKKEKVKDK